jgi:hypothetical protein
MLISLLHGLGDDLRPPLAVDPIALLGRVDATDLFHVCLAPHPDLPDGGMKPE